MEAVFGTKTTVSLTEDSDDDDTSSSGVSEQIDAKLFDDTFSSTFIGSSDHHQASNESADPLALFIPEAENKVESPLSRHTLNATLNSYHDPSFAPTTPGAPDDAAAAGHSDPSLSLNPGTPNSLAAIYPGYMTPCGPYGGGGDPDPSFMDVPPLYSSSSSTSSSHRHIEVTAADPISLDTINNAAAPSTNQMMSCVHVTESHDTETLFNPMDSSHQLVDGGDSLNDNNISKHCFRISTICPDWSYTSGGQKIIIVGEWDKTLEEPCSVLFGSTMVPAQQLKPGVISVVCPPSPLPCTVQVQIVSPDGHVVSGGTREEGEYHTFTYKDHSSPTSWLSVVNTNFHHSLINRLEALESQVQILSSKRFAGDLQHKLCCIALRILSAMPKAMSLPPAPRGLRLIHLAAAIGYSKLVLLLLRFTHLSECNPNCMDDMGNNAVVWACVGGNPNTVYLLLKYYPYLQTSRDGWGRPLRSVYKAGMKRKRGETAARTIQLHYRTYRQRMEVKNAAATRIQAKFRGYKQQCHFEQVRRAVIVIQQTYRDRVRSRIVPATSSTKEVAAKTIQRRWRQRAKSSTSPITLYRIFNLARN